MERARERSDIEGAVLRSRSARAARRRRQRRRLIALAFASILLGGGTALSIAGFDANEAVEAAVGKARSLADLLNQRSPGNRTAAELTKTKRVEHPSADRQIDKGLLAPEVPSAVKLAEILLPAASDDIDAPIALLDSPPVPVFIINSPGGPGMPLPGGDLTPPGGGSTIVPPGEDTHVGFPKDEPKEIVPVPAVPEPGTWAMMLLGFGLIGWQLRRQARPAGGQLPA